MAAPAEVTLQNLSGTYTLNRTLSDPTTAILKMQNVSFLVRQAAQYSTVTVYLRQYADADATGPAAQHLDQEQQSTGGIKNSEERIMDWQPREAQNRIWGTVRARSRYVKLSETEIADEFVKTGWEGQDVVEGAAESVGDSWTAHQLWGFAEVGGERKHVRKVLARKPGQADQRARLVYDYVGPLEKKA